MRRSIEDLLYLIKTYPRENVDAALEGKELELFVRHYSKLLYQAILSCTQKSLQVWSGNGRVGACLCLPPLY